MSAYLQQKAAKQRFLQKGMVVIMALLLIFFVFVTRFALSSTRNDLASGAPVSADAYAMAKQFVRPTIKFNNVTFPETGYQCAEKPDSVFVVKSYAEDKAQSGPKNITSFQITLKFVGGQVGDKKNWRMITLNEN
jgi:hypothetical protein